MIQQKHFLLFLECFALQINDSFCTPIGISGLKGSGNLHPHDLQSQSQSWWVRGASLLADAVLSWNPRASMAEFSHLL